MGVRIDFNILCEELAKFDYVDVEGFLESMDGYTYFTAWTGTTPIHVKFIERKKYVKLYNVMSDGPYPRYIMNVIKAEIQEALDRAKARS